jgi:hypothetical protein
LLLPLVVGACIGSGDVAPSSSAASPTSTTPSLAPPSPTSASASPAAPTSTPTASPTEEATETPTDQPSDGLTGASGPAERCTGSEDNQRFYRGLAEDVSWAAYCPILPSGWFVVDGSYSLSGGGSMEIAYRGPGGARIELAQGAFCDDADGCVPDGSDTGEAAFGDRVGTLLAGDDGSYSIVVDRAADVSWLLTGVGLDEPQVRSIAAALLRIED